MRTGSQYLLLHLVFAVFLTAFHGQRACRTGCHTVAAGLTFGSKPGIIKRSADDRGKTSVHGIDGTAAYDLVTGIYAAVTQDTFIRIIGKEFVCIVDRFGFLLHRIAGLFHTVFHTQILELTVTVSLTVKAADGMLA